MEENAIASLPQDAVCRVAMIGAGGMAREHLRAFADIPQVSIVGIMSRTRSKAEALAQEFNIPAVTDSVEALAALQADLVVITVSANQVHKVVQACCAWPWTILTEKPVGLNLQQSEETLETVRKTGAQVYVALNRRFYSSVHKMKENLAHCTGPRFIEVFDQQEPEKLRKILGKADEIELMFGNSIHTIDFFSHLGRGSVTSVTPILPWNSSVPQAVCAAVTFSSGDSGIYHGLWNVPGPWAVSVTTREERWELRPLESARVQKAGSRTLEEVDLGDLDKKFKPGLRAQAEEAVKAALGLRHNCVSLENAHGTMRIIDAIYKH